MTLEIERPLLSAVVERSMSMRVGAWSIDLVHRLDTSLSTTIPVQEVQGL